MSKAKFVEQSCDLDTGRAVWRLDNVQIAHPHLLEPGMYEGKESTRLTSNFVVGEKLGKELAKKMVQLAGSINKKVKKPGDLKDFKVENNDKLGYILKSSNGIDYPTKVFGGNGKIDKDPIASGAAKAIYSGSIVRAKFEVNYDSGANKIWVNLAAVQFLEDGDTIGASMSEEDLSDGFDAVEGDFGADDTKGSSDKEEADDDFDLGDDKSSGDDDDDFEL